MFRVEFSARAVRDVQDIVAYIDRDSPTDAARWRDELKRKLQSLETMPEACGLAPETERCVWELRQLLHGRYRVIFSIQGDYFYIVAVHHGARRFLAADEIDDRLQ